MSPVYLFIYLFIQILIGFQPNRFMTKYSKKNSKVMEQIKSMLIVFRFLFIL